MHVRRVEARGVGFSEQQSYWSLPFYETSVVSAVSVVKDAHDRQLYDTIHVATSNPAWLYTMKPLQDKFERVPLNHMFTQRRFSTIPRYLKLKEL